MSVSAKILRTGAAAVAATLLAGAGVAERSSGVAFAAPPASTKAEAGGRIQIAQAGANSASPARDPTTVSAAGITLRSLSVALPQSDRRFPGGASADPVNANCTACHSPGMVLTQPKLSAAVWQEEVKKMRLTYKAPIDEADVPAIVAYLAALNP